MRENWYKKQLDMNENAMNRECAPDEIKTGFWRGLKRHRAEIIAEFRDHQRQLYELIASGEADDCDRHTYLDICEAIGE